MNATQEDLALELTARQALAGALALAVADPRCRRASSPLHPGDLQLLRDIWQVYRQDLHPDLALADLGLGELPPASVDIEPLITWLSLESDAREEAYLAIYGLLISEECPPYEVEYSHTTDPTYRAQQMADIAGFYAAFGLEASRDEPDRPDHLSLELEFLAFLLQKQRLALELGGESADITKEALVKFVADHLVWWTPTFARCLENKAARLLEQGISADLTEKLGLLAGVMQVLRAWLAVERLACGVAPNRKIIAPMVVAPETPLAADGCQSCLAADAPA